MIKSLFVNKNGSTFFMGHHPKPGSRVVVTGAKSFIPDRADTRDGDPTMKWNRYDCVVGGKDPVFVEHGAYA